MEQTAADIDQRITIECVFYPGDEGPDQDALQKGFDNAPGFTSLIRDTVLAPPEADHCYQTVCQPEDQEKQRHVKERSTCKFEDRLPVHASPPLAFFFALLTSAVPIPSAAPAPTAAPTAAAAGRFNGAD